MDPSEIDQNQQWLIPLFKNVSFFAPSLESLEWERCRGHQPFKVMNYSGSIIVDWSPDHGQFLEKWSNKYLRWHSANSTLMGNGNETIKWQQFALIPPQLQLQGYPHIQRDIWKLWVVSGNLTIWSGNYTSDRVTLRVHSMLIYMLINLIPQKHV